jgi:hypothetical protein
MHWKKHRYSTYIFIFVTGGLSSALLISREGFWPPSHFHGRAFVRPVIFTRGLLSQIEIFVPIYFKIPRAIKKLWIAFKIYPLKDHVKLWPISVALTLKIRVQMLCMTHCLSTFMPSIFKISSWIRKLCTGNKIYAIT